MYYVVSINRLFMTYIFLINLFRDKNADTVFYKISQT